MEWFIHVTCITKSFGVISHISITQNLLMSSPIFRPDCLQPEGWLIRPWAQEIDWSVSQKDWYHQSVNALIYRLQSNTYMNTWRKILGKKPSPKTVHIFILLKMTWNGEKSEKIWRYLWIFFELTLKKKVKIKSDDTIVIAARDSNQLLMLFKALSIILKEL